MRLPRMLRSWILSALALALLSLPAPAWEWKSATVDRDSLTLGDPLVLTLQITAEAGERVVWPLPGAAQLGGWRLLGADSLQDETGVEGRVLSRRLRLARFKLGSAPLPTPGPLREGQPSSGDTLRLELRSLLPDSAAAADILAPGHISHGWAWWLLRLGGAAILLLAAWLGLRAWLRKAGRVPLSVVHPPDPWQSFLENMGAIEAKGLWRSGQVESHYSELSLALRGLLEDSLGLPCRESTTGELRELLRDTPLSEVDLLELFRLLDDNDWVKYARQWPDAETCARQIERYQKWALLRKDLLLTRHRAREAAQREAEKAKAPEETPARPGRDGEEAS